MARRKATATPSALDILKLLDVLIDNGSIIQKGSDLHRAIKVAISRKAQHEMFVQTVISSTAVEGTHLSTDDLRPARKLTPRRD